MKKISRRDFLRGSAAGAAAIAVGMIPGVASAEEADGEVVASGEKYTATRTSDGWIKVVNEGGATLGYYEDSGVTLIEDDGYAFKDLSKTGELLPYEDWRLTPEERAENAVSLMSIEDMAGLRLNPGTFSLGAEGEETSLRLGDDEGTTLEGYITEHGLRYILSYPHAGMSGYRDWETLANWSNREQKVAEGCGLGLPLIINCDPNTELVSNLQLMAEAASFDPDSVNKLYQEVAKCYRALGISMMLGPQVDLETDPRTQSTMVWSEDPLLAANMTEALINGMQSTYDENGNDTGWGADSVICQMKHFAANNSVEGGRSYHSLYGKYTVFPGDSFDAQMVPYVDGGFNLSGETAQNGAVMITYTIPWSDDSMGDKMPGALNSFILGLLEEYDYRGLVSTDGIAASTLYDHDGSVSEMTYSEQIVRMFSNGIDQLMTTIYTIDDVMEAYNLMVDAYGEEETNANFESAAYDAILPMFETAQVDNPYVVVSDSVSYINSAVCANSEINDMAQSGIVMLKNSDNVICESTGEMKTVYIPLIYEETTNLVVNGDSYESEVTGEWVMPCSEEKAGEYFNVVTDSIDEEGNIVRATDEEIAECELALIMISSPSTGGGYDEETGEYLPISLQYSEYVADSEYVRTESLSGDAEVTATETPYGVVETSTIENRSYYGKSTVATNLSEMELVQEIANRMGDSGKVVICVNASGSMIFSEIEEYADVIFMLFGGGSTSNDNFLALVAGTVEPQGLLPMQMPANMETVEEQYEDVPRDMECYVDADGNIYDFAFGMNWSGVIADDRVATYNVEVLTAPSAQAVE